MQVDEGTFETEQEISAGAVELGQVGLELDGPRELFERVFAFALSLVDESQPAVGLEAAGVRRIASWRSTEAAFSSLRSSRMWPRFTRST